MFCSESSGAAKLTFIGTTDDRSAPAPLEFCEANESTAIPIRNNPSKTGTQGNDLALLRRYFLFDFAMVTFLYSQQLMILD
jgi:hypothetical protein